MKKLITNISLSCVLIINTIIISKAQTSTWDWAKTYAGTGLGGESAQAIVNDKLGYLIYTGSYFSTQINFGGQTVTNTGGGADIFIVKSDTSGNVIWAKSFGGNWDDWPLSITADIQGNIYIGGWFKSTSISFENTTLVNDSAGSGYNADMFLVKLSPTGNVIWAKGWGGKNSDELDEIVYDSQGYIYGTGSFKSNSFNIGNTTLTNDTTDNSSDIFIAKFDSAGNSIWVKYYGGAKIETSKSIALDTSGNVFVSGNFGSNNISIGSNTFNRLGGIDAFIIKYNPSGAIIWAKQKTAGGISNLNVEALAVDNSGNFYLGGSYGISVTFGTHILNTKGAADAYIAAFDNNGNDLWANNIGSSFIDFGNNIVTDAIGNIILSGWFGGPTLYVDTATYANHGSINYDCYLIKYAPNGNRIWAVTYGGSSFDYSYSIALGGAVYIAGKFLSSSIIFGTTTLSNVGGADIFVAKLNGGLLTGISESNFKLDASLFPNPSAGEIFTNSNLNNIEVYNILGILVYKKNFILQCESINLSSFSKGIYFINFDYNKKRLTRKIIVN